MPKVFYEEVSFSCMGKNIGISVSKTLILDIKKLNIREFWLLCTETNDAVDTFCYLIADMLGT